MSVYHVAFIGILALLPVLVVAWDEWRHPAEPPTYWTRTYP